MKRNDSDKKKGIEIDELEIAAYRGRLSRRGFIERLVQLGVSLSVADAMAVGAERAQANRAPLRKEYDYIIVGAGSAGCVLAGRLSATGATVLLIEAGTDQINLPKLDNSRRYIENLGTETDWNYPIEPIDTLNNREQNTPTGRVVGGGGSINAMMWLRGDLRDYWQWRRMIGPNWKLSRMYRALKRVENFLPDTNSPLRGKNGAITVNRYSLENPLTAASICGAQELGIPSVEHNSSKFIDGSGAAEVNILPNGRRSGPAQGYLLPGLEQSALTLLADVMVTSLYLEGSVCRGVKTIMDGQEHLFTAAREVIISAGAFGSPRLLMQSGIGPEDELNSAGIAVAHHLPNVGKNLHDHLILGGLIFSGGDELPSSITLGDVASHSFFRTNSRRYAPNIQVTCMQIAFPPGTVPNGAGISILPSVAKPISRGSLTITGSQPTDPLIINPGFLREAEDLETMLTGFDHAIELGLSNSMHPFVSGIHTPEVHAYMTRQEKIDFIRQRATSGWHPVGSCSAGHNPNDSVVDQYFRVWGIEGLRVVDGSVIPDITGVNIHPSILIIAELAADTIIRGR